jgi:hypothetical protein
MKNKRIIDSWNKIEPDEASKARMLSHITKCSESYVMPPFTKGKFLKMKQTSIKKMLPMAACLAIILIAAICIPLLNLNPGTGNDTFNLVRSTGNVSVSYAENAPATPGIHAKLAWLTEDELFNKYGNDIFKGTIEKIRNIEIDIDGMKQYKSIAAIKVEKVYRGDLKAGDTASILLNCTIDGKMEVEDTGVISSMREGMTGIFMPYKYDETSFGENNASKVYWMELAQYGFSDGERYAFLETDNGLIFDHSAYASIDSAKTLDEVEAYVESMIK